jgi:hypothetical protein
MQQPEKQPSTPAEQPSTPPAKQPSDPLGIIHRVCIKESRTPDDLKQLVSALKSIESWEETVRASNSSELYSDLHEQIYSIVMEEQNEENLEKLNSVMDQMDRLLETIRSFTDNNTRTTLPP